MKKRHVLLAVLAAVMVLSIGVGSAVAYFTASAEAEGAIPIKLKTTTTIEEPDLFRWIKHLVITNDEKSEPVFVRAKGFSGSAYPLTYSGEGWTEGEDGWYEYEEILPAGGSTKELLVGIGNIPEDAVEGQSFNVTVVYESTPVQYDSDGTAFADWSLTLDTGSSEGGR
jgi:predicted ribosomally synthesized peptide with SipW-like signal peptide